MALTCWCGFEPATCMLQRRSSTPVDGLECPDRTFSSIRLFISSIHLNTEDGELVGREAVLDLPDATKIAEEDPLGTMPLRPCDEHVASYVWLPAFSLCFFKQALP